MKLFIGTKIGQIEENGQDHVIVNAIVAIDQGTLFSWFHDLLSTILRDRDRRRKDRDMADIKTDPGVKTDFDGGDFKSDPDRYVKAEKMDD